VLWLAWRRPAQAPALPASQRPGLLPLLRDVLPAVGLVLLVLGSILAGIATPTEAAAVGAVGACVFAALRGPFSLARLWDVAQETVKVSAMVFAILFGAALFSLVFRGLGGDELVHAALSGLPGGRGTAVFAVMLLMFLLGFVLDFIEITFIVVPIVAPVLFALGVDPVWLGVMMAINLQTSFLTPPFGFALFYLRGVAPPDLPMLAMYRGVLPFIALQLGMLGLLALWPGLATWLPGLLYR
jgi:tripartite ATP-independent transporter DctM subunit